MEKNIRVRLLPNWHDFSDRNPDGGPTFARKNSENFLQISWSVYQGGVAPNPSVEDLIRISCVLGEKFNNGLLLESQSGLCDFGRYGTCVFRSPEYPRIQVWTISNGKDFIFATYICNEETSLDEIQECSKIVRLLVLK
jgi:hypothetical protein